MKIFCVGRNYALHAQELGNAVPEFPVIFLKPETALLRMGQPFFLPVFSSDIHYEAEAAVRICRLGKGISEKFAHRYYDKITIGIDFTARTLQQTLKEKGLPWEISKGFDGSAALGEWIDIPEKGVENIVFSLEINGKRVQQGNTSDMLFSINKQIAYISQFYTLKIGDVLFTGTPAGVGAVKPEDTLTGYIESQKLLNLKIK